MFSPESGAEIQARSSKPSIDLATLIELVAKAIPTSTNTEANEASNPSSRQALLFDPQKKRLRLCTSAVLRRLFKHQKFLDAFDPNKGGGFIQDLQMPGFGDRSRIGGHLTQDNAARLPAAVDRLVSAIDHVIDAALPEGTELSSLLLDKPEQQLSKLAKVAGTTFKHQANPANLVPLAFEAQSSTANSDAVVAKVISAIERIEANDYFERLCSAVSEYLQYRDFDEDEIEAATDSLVAERERVDSQITRFLNFLDNEALSRVRLNVTIQIMEAIADNARTANRLEHQLLAEYVSRITNLVEVIRVNGCAVDLTAHYGVAAEFDLLEYLSKTTFYSCLSVWPEWKTQIFEEKASDRDGTGYAVGREVSYRFRINGQNPESGKPAFVARLDKIEAELLNDEETTKEQPGRLCYRLAELIFLAIVVPGQEAISNDIHQLLATLKAGGKEAVSEVLQSLRERSTSMQAMTRLEGAESGVRDLLVRSQQSSREQVEWFKHIEICDKPETPGLLFSVKVTTEISEHNLTIIGTPDQIQVKRLLPQQLLQICWIPFHAEKTEDGQRTLKISPSATTAEAWVLPASIHVEFDTQTLTRNKNDEKSKQYHAAAVVAFAVVVYCSLWRIIQRLQQSGDKQAEFTTLMLRLQEMGKPSNEGSGDSYVYAAAQSIEAMLAQDTSLRMQGLALENLNKKNPQFTKYVKAGTFNALLSAFPIAISMPTPTVAKIGLISYATRPCDEISAFSDEKSYLFLTQSYVATAVQQPLVGYELKAERMQSDVVDSPERLKKQRLVQEEIGHLKAQGCQHVILVSHSYGSRHLNRTADYNSPLNPKEFLEEVFQTFPDLTIYTMLRDVFSATRLRLRSQNESAFEILRAGDHSSFLQSIEAVRLRDLIPVYTFATLHAIEAAQRPQSGFCVYFLVSDQRISNIDWTERPRQHLIDPDQESSIRLCLISVLRGLHFIEAERGVNGCGQLVPVLDPFSWISPTTVEGAGEVQVIHTRRRGRVLLSYPALLSHLAHVLHRKK